MSKKPIKKQKKSSKKVSSKDYRVPLYALFVCTLIFGIFFTYAYSNDLLEFQQWDSIAIAQTEGENVPSGSIKIGFLTDPHVRSYLDMQNGWQLRPVYKENIEKFSSAMKNDFLPDVTVINGDVVEGTQVPLALCTKEMQSVKSLVDSISNQKLWVIGNHDLRCMTKDQWKEILGIDYVRNSFEVGRYKIIVVDSNFYSEEIDAGPKKQSTRGLVSPREMEWLENELQDRDRIKLVFMHHPPLTQAPNRDQQILLRRADELQKLFSKYNVAAVFGGHLEISYHEKINGVDYYAIPGMTKSSRSYPGAYAEITMKRRKASVEIFFQKEDGTYANTTLQ